LVEPLKSKNPHPDAAGGRLLEHCAVRKIVCVRQRSVSTHLRNINGKLNAQSRTKAVAIAARLCVIR
jgi:LuxR family maltose regulon positive regulatory protein